MIPVADYDNHLLLRKIIVYYKKRYFRRLKMRAFTLIEVLVTIGIISILLALCIPLYRQTTDFTMDMMPEALRYTRASAGQGYAVMMVRKDELGTFAICMKAGGIPLTAVIGLDTKRIRVSDYEPAVVVYDSKGRVCIGLSVIIDGKNYTATNRLILDDEVKMLHRYMGGIVN